MAQDNLTAYAQWLVQNKDKKGTPEFDKVARAFQMLQAAGPRQAQAPVNPPGTGISRAFQRGVIGTKQGIQAGIATNAANTLESMDVDRLTTIRRALGLVVPKDALAMMEADGTLQALGGVRNEEELNRWFDSLDRDFDLGPQNVAKLKAMVGGAEAAKSDYRAPGGKFETVRETGQNALTRASELEADRAALPMSPVAQRGAQDFQDAEGVMDWARKSFKDPMAALAFIGETAAETGPAMAAGIGTSVVTGNPLLGAGIMIAASTPREYGGEVMSFLRDQDINVSDPQAIREAIDNGNIMAEAQKRGLTKAAIISAFEAIGMKGGGGILLQGGKQAFTGGAGEAASQVTLDGEITSAKEVALEAVAELATTPGEAAILYTKNGTLKDPSSLSDTESQAAASLAQRIRTIANQNGYNLKDVGNTGDAKQALEAAHEQISGQIKEIVANPAVKKYLNPKQAKTLDQLIDDYAAAQVAIRQGKNKVKSKVTQENFNAIMRLLPPTVEAQQIANLMREGNQLTDLFKNGTKGGISQFTDTFNPFTREDGSYDPSKVISGMANKGVAIATMGGSLPYQFSAVGAGRAIDAVTGRRSAVNRFVRKYEGKDSLPDPVGPSLIAAERLKKEQDDARAAELGGLPQVDKDNSPIGTILSGTGLDRDGLKAAMTEIKGAFPDVKALDDVFGDIRKNLDGGTNKIRNLNDIIPVINQHLNTPDTTVQRAAAPDQLLAQRGGVNIPNIDQTPAQNTPTPDVMSQAPKFGPQFTTQENYNRGIEANKAMNAELVEGVTTDPELNRVQKGRLITSLDVLANNLGSDPVAAAQEQVQKLEEAGVPAEAVEKYIQPYVDRVTRQQAARDVGPRMAMAPQEDAPANADLWSVPPQAFNSADTSINSGKLPAGFTELKKQGVFEEGQTVVDIGGGRFDNAVEDLAKQGVTLKVYDPFNRSAMHNETVVSEIANGGADAAVSNNVLNVIQEPENINRVVRQAHNAIPDGGKAYFTVYEGKGDGVGTETSKGWQRNEKTQDYVARIEEVFGQGNVVRKGKVITATKAAAPAIRGETTNIQLPNQLGSAFEFAKGSNFSKGRDFKLALQEKALAAQKEEGIDLSELSDENINRLADYVVADALVALQDNANAIGWYDRTVTDALSTLSEVYPEIQTNPKNKLQFIWALAVTSNGTKVDKNFELAANAYDHLQRTGRFPTNIGIGEAARAINGGLQQYHTMLEKFERKTNSDEGDHQLLADFMNSQVPVKQIEQEYGVKISGEGKNTLVRGASILGPKIGNGFFSNLYGNFDALTMDRWLMRTVGRHRGTLVKLNQPMIKQKTSEIKTMLKDASPETMKGLRRIFKPTGTKIGKNMTNEEVYVLAARIAKESTSADWRTELNGVSEDLRKAGNALAKYRDGQVEAPAGAKERDFIRAVFQQALERLNTEPSVTRASNAGLTMSDLQALLWYPEKRLYDSSKAPKGQESRGYADDEAPDYANAARKLVEARKGSPSGSGLGSLGPDGPGGGAASGPNARPALAPVQDGVAGVLSQRIQGGRVPRGPVPSTQEVKQAAEPVRQALSVGLKGSEFENGIKDINQVRKLADAIGVVLKMSDDTGEIARAAGSEPGEGRYQGVYIPSQQTAYALNPNEEVSDFKSYIIALHEVAHAINDMSNDAFDAPYGGYPANNAMTGTEDLIRSGSFDNEIAKLAIMANFPKKQQVKVINEIKLMQDQGRYGDGADKDVRYLGGAKRSEADRRETPYYKYIRSASEFAVDPVLFYLHDPKRMKKEFPATAKMIRDFFKNSGKINFYSHPLAMAVAVVLASMLKAEQEEEQKKQMPPGALNQPMMPGALSA